MRAVLCFKLSSATQQPLSSRPPPPMSSASAAGASADAPVQVLEDFAGLVQLLSDGTVTRRSDANGLPVPSSPPTLSAEWKDVVYSPNRGLKLRIYKPAAASSAAAAPNVEGDDAPTKLPVLVYFHGGGFCLASFELINFHAGALRLAAELPALVLSADYRLAPEHRLPAAFDDADSVLAWLRAQASAAAEPWLAESADFGRVFVGGDSAGGTISHHVAARHGAGSLALAPLRLAGYVLLWTFFGG